MKKMKKFDVSYCLPVLVWEGVEATSKEEAIKKCVLPKYVQSEDGQEAWMAIDVSAEED